MSLDFSRLTGADEEVTLARGDCEKRSLTQSTSRLASDDGMFSPLDPRVVAMTACRQAGANIPTVIWWNNFERIFMAVDDLNCGELLG